MIKIIFISLCQSWKVKIQKNFEINEVRAINQDKTICVVIKMTPYKNDSPEFGTTKFQYIWSILFLKNSNDKMNRNSKSSRYNI